MNESNFINCRRRLEHGFRLNLHFLINKRYNFIKSHITKSDKGVEFGAGAGLSEYYLKNYNLIITDYCQSKWIPVTNVDAHASKFENSEFDYVIMSNVIHHLNKPSDFFKEAFRILKPGGKILIIEPYSSIVMRILVNIVRHEQVNYSVFPLHESYSLNSIAKSDIDGNNAIAEMIFKNPDKFLQKFDGFKIIHKEYSEFLILMNSGGLYVNTFYVPLPKFLLKFCDFFDKVFISVSPNIFALGMYLVIQKKEDSKI